MMIRKDQEEEWLRRYECLKGFVKDNGRLPMTAEVYNSEKIGIWLRTQRKAYDARKLTKERQILLEELSVEFKKEFPTRLYAIREEKSITRVAISEITEIPLNTLKDYEQGKRQLHMASFETVHKLSKALGCNMKELCEESYITATIKETNIKKKEYEDSKYGKRGRKKC